MTTTQRLVHFARASGASCYPLVSQVHIQREVAAQNTLAVGLIEVAGWCCIQNKALPCHVIRDGEVMSEDGALNVGSSSASIGLILNKLLSFSKPQFPYL